MESLKNLLSRLKDMGCCGVKISFEDEGAQLNEMITMRYLTASLNLELSVKIGGSESNRDIIDCNYLCCDSIVAPMVESKFSLSKFISSIKKNNSKQKIGFNLETITSYNNINELSELFEDIDFITFGRVDFISSLNYSRDIVENSTIYDFVYNTFKIAKGKNLSCYMGGCITKNSREFIYNLCKENLIDKFETRYIIFDVKNINFNNFDDILHTAIFFEFEWLKYIKNRYSFSSLKDDNRIKMIEARLN